jgi:trehalose 6-phosphate phosphatase
MHHIKGVLVERKKYAIAVHYRNVADENIQEVKNAVYKELEVQDKLKEGKGKKVLELKPDIDWHKGKAVEWLKKALKLKDEEYISVYIGDDITDEDAFKEIKG